MARGVDSAELFNLLQHQKTWPSAGPPILLDLRGPDAFAARHIRAAHRASLTREGTLDLPPHVSWGGKAVFLYDEQPESLDDHPVCRAVLAEGSARAVLVLRDAYSAFEAQFRFLTTRGDSASAMKRPIYPSCILPGLLYLGDLADASALPRLREHLHITHAVTALAELPPSLKASLAEWRGTHVWCNVRDVEEADIKEHFDRAYEAIEAARAAGTAVLVHCSRGVSRSASLCMAYLMRREGMSAADAKEFVQKRRPIVQPNEGFWRCLQEFEKERSGGRSGVYVPRKTKALDELECELPPSWAAAPTHTKARLVVAKGGEVVDELEVGEHEMYTFGRSLTCDFQLEHPSASRQHAALVHHENGGVYLIDLKASHGTAVNGKPLKPFEAYLLREGAEVTFGASTRSYKLVGIPTAASSSWKDANDEEAHASGSKRPYQPPMHPKKWEKKKRRWLNGPKAHSKMSENERVAQMAGSGSGCMGPGFD